jgi:DNA-binding MarR family transcriptional regulator
MAGATVSRCANTPGIAGLVAREREESNRRYVVIYATPSGRKFVSTFHR